MTNLLLGQAGATTPVDAFNAGYDRSQRMQANRLLGQAIADPDNSAAPIGQAAAIDPRSALAVKGGIQDDQDRAQKKLAGAATYLLQAYQSGNPQQVEGAYQSVRPYLNQLGQQLGQGEASPNFTTDMLPHLYQIVAQAGGDTAINGAIPTAFREFQMQAKAAGIQPGSPEFQQAAKVALGVAPRAVTGAAKIGFTEGPNGEKIPYVFDPTSATVAAMSANGWTNTAPNLPGSGGGSGAPKGGGVANVGGFQDVPADTPVQQDPPTLVDAKRWLGQGLSDREVGARLSLKYGDKFGTNEYPAISINGSVATASYPSGNSATPAPQGNPNLIGRTPEATARATQDAKNASDLAVLPQTEAIKTAADIARAQGAANVKTATDRTNQARANASAAAVWSTAMNNLQSSLGGTDTGPLAGRLPAMTSSQQIADGAIAQMAPVLKQLFRQAGEGAFTDDDQRVLMNMIPSRTDTPSARDAKIKAVDALVQAKLHVSPATTPAGAGAANAPQTEAEYDALPSGSVYTDPDDGKTYRKP